MVTMRAFWFIRFLWILAALPLLAGVALLLWSILTPIQTLTGTAESQLVPSASSPSTSAAPTASPVGLFWQLDIRRSLHSEAPVATNTPPASFNLRLVATAIDIDHPYAVFFDARQQATVCSIGQTVGGMTVISIQQGKVVLANQNQRFELSVPDQYGGK